MSWFSRLFGSEKRDPTSLDIVAEYGSVLEKSQMDWTGVHDVSNLPFDKDRIKAAIFDAAAEFRDVPKQIEALGAGLMILGRFQPLSNGLMQMPKPEEVEAMDEEEFKDHIQTMVARKDGDMSASKAAAAESAAIMAEWKAHLKSLGIPNA